MPFSVSEKLRCCAGPLARRLIVGRLRRRGGEQFSRDGLELFDGQPRGVFGEEAFHVQREVVVLLADRVEQ